MNKQRLARNEPAPDRAKADENLDPNSFWSPEPSRVYDALDAAVDEGAKRPGDSAIDRADALMEANQDTTGGCAQQGRPFVIPAHGFQDTSGGVHDNSAAEIPLRSGQGQSGLPGDGERPGSWLATDALKPPARQGT